ncbi:MAG: ABC transporter ATP-binding protein [Actinobacteria bacterium]|nr:ABC transporter ATP-binding protein [Actinomycetota bacterium]
MSLLTVDDLDVAIGGTPILRSVSFALEPGEALGIVGESGSGKSMTARAIARLLPRGAVATGKITFDGTELLAAGTADMRRVRDGGISLVFQDPRAAINPVRSIGDFLAEGLRTNRKIGKAEARRRAVQVLEEVRISRAEARLAAYPHQLSGGLLQRVMIAAALLSEPRLILADEPTTALDVTTQAEIMAILEELRRERGLASIFITHDLELAAATCDRIAVMYAGELVEVQAAETLLERPHHPYTAALLAARPGMTERVPRLPAIPGRPLAAGDPIEGCRFAPRCPLVIDRCRSEHPALAPCEQSLSRCWRAADVKVPEAGAEQLDHA